MTVAFRRWKLNISCARFPTPYFRAGNGIENKWQMVILLRQKVGLDETVEEPLDERDHNIAGLEV